MSNRVQDVFPSLDVWVSAWHHKFKRWHPNWATDDMYANGQYDEFPYVLWEENADLTNHDYAEEIKLFGN